LFLFFSSSWNTPSSFSSMAHIKLTAPFAWMLPTFPLDCLLLLSFCLQLISPKSVHMAATLWGSPCMAPGFCVYGLSPFLF
jgi:hypothetical protein